MQQEVRDFGAAHTPDIAPCAAPADPWAHRTLGMRCGACMFFVEKVRPGGHDLGSASGRLGRCRRHAPTMGGFPAVFAQDWCGDHKLDENKL